MEQHLLIFIFFLLLFLRGRKAEEGYLFCTGSGSHQGFADARVPPPRLALWSDYRKQIHLAGQWISPGSSLNKHSEPVFSSSAIHRYEERHTNFRARNRAKKDIHSYVNTSFISDWPVGIISKEEFTPPHILKNSCDSFKECKRLKAFSV